MTSQTLTNHAKARYEEFEFALNAVRATIDELTKITGSTTSRGTVGRFEGWQTPTHEEVKAAVRKASTDLDELRAASIKYKTELIARGWRV
ncbi:MAG: hypothetical protein QOI21_31 [Actinomycetota bacterium]|jgi:hypothetical protein|nr:hypothetical protein [Actinomycetota bacterium]